MRELVGILSPSLGRSDANQFAHKVRWVVADVETSGLNPAVDKLISIGAVAVTNGAVDLADSFEVVLRQDIVSTDANILVHRISRAQQREGIASHEALQAFVNFIGDSPLVGYHAQFDEMIIARAIRLHLNAPYRQRWLDLAALAPAIDTGGQLMHTGLVHGARARSLDWWLQRYSIVIRQRHHASADALATAQLLIAILQRVAARNEGARVAGLFKLAKDYVWSMSASQ